MVHLVHSCEVRTIFTCSERKNLKAQLLDSGTEARVAGRSASNQS